MHAGISYEPVLTIWRGGSVRAFSRVQSMHELWIRGELMRTKLDEPQENSHLAHDIERASSEVGRVGGARRWTKNVRAKYGRQVILTHFVLFLMLA